MKASSNEQTHHSNELLAHDARLPYEPPALAVMGKVEHLTAFLPHGVPDLLSHGNIV